MENTSPTETNNSSLKAYIAIVIVVLIAVIAIIYLSNQAQSDSNDSQNNDNEQGTITGETISYTISASNFEYSLKEISASPGDIVKLTLNVEEGAHSFVIDGLPGARTNALNAGESETIQFQIPENASGSYTFYCDTANHRNMGLEGKLVIK